MNIQIDSEALVEVVTVRGILGIVQDVVLGAEGVPRVSGAEERGREVDKLTWLVLNWSSMGQEFQKSKNAPCWERNRKKNTVSRQLRRRREDFVPW